MPELKGLHVFVAMPFGEKQGVDFNRVYQDYLKPALEAAGLEVFRADEELRAGSIHRDMFQELLLADLVVVDLSIDNPNVWYELGVRHALRARGVVQVQAQRDYLPFDVHGQRTLSYHLKDGAPDPAHLEADRAALRDTVVATIESWHGLSVSPVYDLLPFVTEPDWKQLKVGNAREFWEKHERWEQRIEVARRRERPGDILLLSDEGATRELRLEAYRTAGKALRELGQFSYALDRFEQALAIEPGDLESRRQKGILLGRLNKHDEAKVWLRDLTRDHPDDAECWALLGRVEKDAWIAAWRGDDKSAEQMREDAAYEDALLREAIEPYATGFRRDPGHYYSGINAVTLLHVLADLTGDDGERERREAMEGGLRWTLSTALERDARDYWARATLADLELLTGDERAIEQAYKGAVAVSERQWFALDSSRQQLFLLRDLGFRVERVEVALGVLERALARIEAPKQKWQPRLAFLFSGHMVDRDDRPEPRFPADKEGAARQAIADKLDELEAGSEDLAMCGGACGGDLLFAEQALERGLRLELRIPFDEPKFLQESVSFAGDAWRDRFYAVKEHERTRVLVMPDELGPAPQGSNPFARNNLWQLYTALSWGPESVRFICLWNRKGGDGPGGTQHMHDSVLQHSGRVYVLDTNELW